MSMRMGRVGIAAAVLFLAGCGGNTTTTATTSTTAGTTLPSASLSAPESTATSTQSTATSGAQGEAIAIATLETPEGDEVGTVEVFAMSGGSGVLVMVKAQGLEPGFHGMHVHSVGRCEPDSADPKKPENRGNFLSAGGHIGVGESAHPEHGGDLSSLQIRSDGAGEATTTSSNLDPDKVFDTDGSAIIVHLGADNFGNVPSRYASAGPDTDTQNTGDSGGRAACGVVERAQG